MANPHKALVIDNDSEVLQEVRNILSSLGHQCCCISTQEEAEDLLKKHSFCYVLLDLELPVRSNQIPKIQVGFNLLERIRANFSKEQLPIIIMTAHGKGHEYPTRAFKMGADDYIKKPFDDESQPLEDKIREATQKTCEQRSGSCPNTRSARGARPRSAAPPKGKRSQSGTYQTRHTFHFNGECRKRRYLIRINGRDARVRLETFTCLWKLAVQLLNSPPGWTHQADLNDNVHSAMFRLKKDLKKIAGLDGVCIENDGHGKFRLSTPPENITYDEEPLKTYHSALFEQHAPKRRC